MQRILESSRGKFKGNVMKTRLGVVEDQTYGIVGNERIWVRLRPTTQLTNQKFKFEITNKMVQQNSEIHLNLICTDENFKRDMTARGTIVNIRDVVLERIGYGKTVFLHLLCANKTYFMKCSVTLLLNDPMRKTLIENEIEKYNKIKECKIEDLFCKHFAHGRLFVQNMNDSYFDNLEVVILEDAGVDLWKFKLEEEWTSKLSVFISALEILQKLHSKGLSHCDTKLDNFAIDGTGKTRLIDPETLFDFSKSSQSKQMICKLKDLNQWLLSHPLIWRRFGNKYPVGELPHVFKIIKETKALVPKEKEAFFPWDKFFLDVDVFFVNLFKMEYESEFKECERKFNENQTKIDMDLIYSTLKDPTKLAKIIQVISAITNQIGGKVNIDPSYVVYTYGTDDPVTAIQPSNPAPPNQPQQQQQQIVQYYEQMPFTVGQYTYNFNIVKDSFGSIILDRFGSPLYYAVDVFARQMWLNVRVNHIFPDFNSAISVN